MIENRGIFIAISDVKMKNTKIVLIAMLLMISGVFAVPPTPIFVSPTPANSTFTAGHVLNMTETFNLSFDINTSFQIDGVNYTCTRSADNKSCSLDLFDTITLNTSQTYTVVGWGNFSDSYYATETRMIIYQGCGQVWTNVTQFVDIPQENEVVCFDVMTDDITIEGNGHSIVGNGTNYATMEVYSTDNVTVHDWVLSNTAFGIDVYESRNTNVTNSVLRNMIQSCIWNDESVNTSIFENDISNCTNGIEIDESNFTAMYMNHIYSSGVGVFIDGEADFAISLGNHYYSNAYDYVVNPSIPGAIEYIVMQDNFGGTFLYMDDVADGVVEIRGGSFAFTGDPSLSSINNKGVNLTQTTGSIDNIVFFWNNSDTTGYDESTFQLWNTTMLNNTPDTANNYIDLTDYDGSGVLYLVGEDNTAAQGIALEQMITILILGIILVVIIVVVPNAMGLSVDSGPVMVMIGLSVMLILVYSFITGAI